ncbi:hypothetical protein [Gracilimonas sp.]|uniref:hypothetical protein n=1 Tax=Gracilimonas sp. TaxID=1974203 RepID=UPI0032ED6CC4
MFLIYTAGIFYWFEAEKEVRVLCSIFAEGKSVEMVRKTLDTGNLLNYSDKDKGITVNSIYTLNSAECTISLSESTAVIESVYRQSFRLEIAAGIVAAVTTFLLAGFQLLLSFGLPWGEFAWGGFHKELPKSLRMGSFVSFVLLTVGGFSVLSSIGFMELISSLGNRIIIPLLTLLFMGSVAGNFNSKSEKEKMIMIPVSIILFCTYIIVCINVFG